MQRSVNSVDLDVDESLAQILVEEGLGARSGGYRSSVMQLVANSLDATAVTISLLQGPLTVIQLRQLIGKWRERRKANREGDLGKIIVKGPRGDLVAQVHPDTDLEALAKQLQRALFPPTFHRSDDPEDLLG